MKETNIVLALATLLVAVVSSSVFAKEVSVAHIGLTNFYSRDGKLECVYSYNTPTAPVEFDKPINYVVQPWAEGNFFSVKCQNSCSCLAEEVKRQFAKEGLTKPKHFLICDTGEEDVKDVCRAIGGRWQDDMRECKLK